MNRIKKRLEKTKGKWIEKLPNVLWAYQTTPWKATNEMPYALTFKFEAIIPLEISLPIIQSKAYRISHNVEVLARDTTLMMNKEKMH